ncbi:MAG TPA: hypothetical protein VK601_08385 [Kofleriaceae bacterium]|nr:hypothetical protein [Kofleriaceae bacterium]
MPDWVLAAERAYVAAAIASGRPEAVDPGGAPGCARAPSSPEAAARAIAAAAAVASRYLAVGTPRSFGIVIDVEAEVEAAALSLLAHRTWFDPRDIRCASTGAGAAALAAGTGGRVVSVEQALACDIVHIQGAGVRVTPSHLRRGTHVNAGSDRVVDPELFELATVVREAELPALAAGLVDGRQLDEITIFLIDGAPIAATAV